MPKITEMWAWVSVEKGEDDEGVIGWRTGDFWMPLVGADKARIESLRQFAEMTAQLTNKPVRLVKFSTREDIEVIQPSGGENR